MSRQDLVKNLGQVLGACGLVVAATAVGRLLDVDLTAAALLLVVAVLVATLLGRLGAVVGTIAGFAALDYFFTEPRESFDVQKGDDLVALVAFAMAAGVLGWTVSRLTDLRRTAEQRERETKIRFDLTTRLLAGEDPQTVMAGAAEALVALFALTSCSLSAGDVTTTARGPGTPGEVSTLRLGPLAVEATAGSEHALTPADRALLEALVAGLAAPIDRLRLEAEAREARVAAQVGRTRSGFLSAVTHNLRTPLASIKAATSTLRAPDLELDPPTGPSSSKPSTTRPTASSVSSPTSSS